jgi:hypothetical protein
MTEELPVTPIKASKKREKIGLFFLLLSHPTTYNSILRQVSAGEVYIRDQRCVP